MPRKRNKPPRGSIGERIDRVIDKFHLNTKKMAEDLGIHKNRLSDYRLGKTRIPEEIVRLICLKYGIDEHWLKTGEGDMFQKSGIPGAFSLTESIPVLGRVPAGFPEHIPESDIIDYINIPEVPKGAYALIVKGDSMSPTFRDGDYVIFRPNEEIRSGDIVIVNNEWGESMIKRYREKDGEKFLVSDNPEYPTLKPNRHYQIMGKVIKGWRPLKV
ncbi:MAG: helix-turn-helix domain-containing protein [Deferribacteres bacterium]|nr:helix-turn-helix domain-containing protein [Deferribacteres bacterium]